MLARYGRFRSATVRAAGLLLSVAALATGCSDSGHASRRETGPLRLVSAAIPPGGTIPINYSCAGADTSPPIAWHGAAPAGTRTWALVLTDEDVRPGPWVQWLVTDIPVGLRALQAGQIPSHAVIGRASNGTVGFVGVCPPAGKIHHYTLTVYAVRRSLALQPGATATQALRAITAASVSSTTLSARSAR